MKINTSINDIKNDFASSILGTEYNKINIIDEGSNELLSSISISYVRYFKEIFMISEDMRNIISYDNEYGNMIFSLTSFVKNKGYGLMAMKEAIRVSDCNVIYSTVELKNIESINLHFKIGFKIVACDNRIYLFKYIKQ